LKVVVIQCAEAMNVNAANSLLKSLEEPPGDTLMLLVSGRPASLLPTIRSRCQSVLFPVPDNELASIWLDAHLLNEADAGLLLSLANGAPLKALGFAEGDVLGCRQALLHGMEEALRPRADMLKVAKEWSAQGTDNVIYWLTSYVTDMLRFKASAHPPVLNNPDLSEKLQHLEQQFLAQPLLDFSDLLPKATRSLRGNANAKLVVEELALAWRIAYGRGKQRKTA
jgi:DNA polymerase-3 subunit delta'